MRYINRLFTYFFYLLTYFTISEVAADWHEPMVPQRTMWLSIARANGQLDPRCSQQTHHRPNQPHQAFTPQPTIGEIRLISRPADGRRLSQHEHTVRQQLAQGCLQWTGCRLNPQPLGYESDTLLLHRCTHRTHSSCIKVDCIPTPLLKLSRTRLEREEKEIQICISNGNSNNNTTDGLLTTNRQRSQIAFIYLS